MIRNYTVRVKPGSKKGPLVEADEQDGLVVYVRERAVDGKANEAVVALLAKHFGLPKSQLRVIRGFASRVKLVRADTGISREL